MSPPRPWPALSPTGGRSGISRGVRGGWCVSPPIWRSTPHGHAVGCPTPLCRRSRTKTTMWRCVWHWSTRWPACRRDSVRWWPCVTSPVSPKRRPRPHCGSRRARGMHICTAGSPRFARGWAPRCPESWRGWHAMSDRWPAPTPRDEVFARVVERGRRIRMINRVVTGLLVSSAVAAGVWLGYNGVLPFGSTAGATITGGGLPYYLCPATAEAGEVHDGDRVLVTGVDESGNWLEIRDPQSLEARVWVQREYVDPDRDLDVPVAPCALEVGRFDRLASAEETTTTTTTTTTPPDEETTTTTTTTTVPSTTTTTAPATTTSTAPTTTTTTTAAPAPVIGT